MTDETLLDIYRAAMRHVAATVYAVTTGHGGERFGIIATAVSSLSFDPPSLLVCVNRSASLHEPLASAETFCVNVLGQSNRDVADNFVSSTSGKGRFAVGNWEDIDGVPVLADAQSSLVCRVVHRHAYGTHTIFIGDLIAARHRQNAQPLTYYDGAYIDMRQSEPLDPGRK